MRVIWTLASIKHWALETEKAFVRKLHQLGLAEGSLDKEHS